MSLQATKKTRTVAIVLVLTVMGLLAVQLLINRKTVLSDAQLHTDCSGEFCGAVGNRYTGHGVGIWTYRNAGSQTQALDIALDGLRDDTVTLVFSNGANAEATLDGDLTSRGKAPPLLPAYVPSNDPVPETPYLLDMSGQTRTWNVPQIIDRKAATPRAFVSTLRAQATIKGFRYRIWVADDEWTPNMQVQLPRLAALLFGVRGYPGLLPQYFGIFPAAPWGPAYTANGSLLSPSVRDIDFVVAPNGAGNLQFFDSSQLSGGAGSNRALAMFMGSEAIACRGLSAGLCLDLSNPDHAFATTNTLLHEFTHLVHYYQREVRSARRRPFDLWLKEAIASSQGFTVALSRFPASNPLVFEIGSWFSGKYACGLTSVEAEPGAPRSGACSQNYYGSGQAFLLYLVGQYGTGIYKQLLAADGTSIDAVDAAIRACGGPGFAEAFRRWGGMLALLPKNAPAGYGYPGTRVGDFALPSLDGASFAALRQLPPPAQSPVKLAPYSHWPLADVSQTGRYERHVMMPPGVAVTVYVQYPADAAGRS